MTAIHHASATLPSAPRTASVARAMTAIANVVRAWRNRRAFYRLGELSDAQLADIGLVRADLHVAMGNSFGDDPTAQLGAIALARAGRF